MRFPLLAQICSHAELDTESNATIYRLPRGNAFDAMQPDAKEAEHRVHRSRNAKRTSCRIRLVKLQLPNPLLTDHAGVRHCEAQGNPPCYHNYTIEYTIQALAVALNSFRTAHVVWLN